MTPYIAVLFAHSWVRWIVLGLGVTIFLQRLRAWRTGEGVDLSLHRWFIAALDAQFALGLVLYAVLSPIPRQAVEDFGAAMGDSVVRFHTIEHVFGMVVAIAAAHVGYDRLRRKPAGDVPVGEASPDVRLRRFAFMAQAIWMLATLASIPWPGLPYGRPLFRLPF